MAPLEPVRILGVWMSGNQGTDAHRPIAQGRAWDVFASLKHVLACKLLNAKVGAVLLWAASVWRPSQAAVAAVCGMQAKMLASMIRLPMRPGNTCWLELHRRRLRKAWRLICLRPVLSLSPFRPWHVCVVTGGLGMLCKVRSGGATVSGGGTSRHCP